MERFPKRLAFDLTVWAASLAAGWVLVLQTATAADRPPAAGNEHWQAECGSCHIAYPPRLLPPEAWHRLMRGLDRHFGVDASVDADTAVQIGAFLERNSAGKRRGQASGESLRITDTPWFRHEHDEVPRSVWNHPIVQSPANCAACHTKAEGGDFRERNVRLPR